jgi:hypothetical protein
VEPLQLPLALPDADEADAMAGATPPHISTFSCALTSFWCAGPTDWSFWVLRGQVLAGAYPKRQHLVADLLKAGASSSLLPEHGVQLTGLFVLSVGHLIQARQPSFA